MLITSTTKISEILKHNIDAIDAIASINKNFRKLKNPILRRVLARRINIKDAAKIGGVSVDEFFNVLRPLGFETRDEQIKQHNNQPTIMESNTPITITKDRNIVELDVRAGLEKGIDPFKEIMVVIKTLKENEVLKLINTFEPIPLINILNEKGYISEVERPEKGIVNTYFIKSTDSSIIKEKIATENNIVLDFETAHSKFKNHMVKIDVRAMEMPEPMVTILNNIETLAQGHALFVQHKKFPKYLIPELKTRGYALVENRKDDYNIELIIYKI